MSIREYVAELAECCTKALGTVVLKAGDGAERAVHQLVQLFDAPEEPVREAAVGAFSRPGAFETKAAPMLAERAAMAAALLSVRD
ncbi:MAG: hypothetical protein GY769_12325, partial [bacterium]|nr:hypothetical protein [bacterium]